MFTILLHGAPTFSSGFILLVLILAVLFGVFILYVVGKPLVLLFTFIRKNNELNHAKSSIESQDSKKIEDLAEEKNVIVHKLKSIAIGYISVFTLILLIWLVITFANR